MKQRLEWCFRLVLIIVWFWARQANASLWEMKMMKELMMKDLMDKHKSRNINLKGSLLPPVMLGFNFAEKVLPSKQQIHHVKQNYEKKSGSKIIKVPYPVHVGDPLKPWEKTIDNFMKMRAHMMEERLKTKRYHMKTLYKKHKTHMFKEMMKEKFKPIYLPLEFLLRPQGPLPPGGPLMPPGPVMPPTPPMGRSNSQQISFKEKYSRPSMSSDLGIFDDSYEDYDDDYGLGRRKSPLSMLMDDPSSEEDYK